MRRVLFVCSAFLAAQLSVAAAAPASEDVPVTPALAAVADSKGLAVTLHPSTFAADIVQLIYGPDVRATEALSQLRVRGKQDAEDPAAEATLVPVPFSTDFWSRVVFRHPVAPRDLLTAILLDRRAALLCHGLAGLDDETRAFLEQHPAIVVDIYNHVAPEFGTFGASLHVRGGRIVPPGGADAAGLWEAAVGATVDRPDRFIRELYAGSEGRLAYLYDVVSELDAPHLAFVTGAWINDSAVRRARFVALAAAVVHGYREWPVDERPFVRPVNDFAILVTRLKVESSGAPAAPASRSFWNSVFDIADATPAEAVREEHGLIDAAYIAEASGVGDMYVRGDRCEQLAFAQRVFAGVEETDKDTVSVLRMMPHQRMLLLSLERMGIVRPAVYAAASRAAREATDGDARHAFWTLTQFQGSLALLAHMRAAGTMDTAAAERLVTSLSTVPIVDGRYDGGIARWMERELLPALPAADHAETRLLLGLSGKPNDPSNPRVEWEGQTYRLDFAAANVRRLHAVREKQGGYSLDVALDLARVADQKGPSPSAGDGHTKARSLAALADSFSPRSRNALPDTMAPGVTAPPPARERIDRVVGELQRLDERRDADRVLRATEPLVETADLVLSEALLSLVYALDLGDPDGTALLASNVALRHDFGFALHEGEGRARRPWDVPRQDFQPGVPWRVTGSLVGLDIALAPLALKRMDIDRPASPPRLRSIEREALAVNAALLDRTRLRDGDRQVIVAAIARGRARIEALTARDIDAVADAIRMDGWRRRSVNWTMEHAPRSVPGLFSLIELVELGGGAPGVNLDAWGLSAHLRNGCLCTQMPAPGGWRLYEGRAQLAFLSFVVPDLNLRLAEALDEMHLPAALEAPVLAAALQDLIDDAAPGDANDWLAVAQAAQALTRQRIEDYVAAAAAVDGPLVPLDEAGAARNR